MELQRYQRLFTPILLSLQVLLYPPPPQIPLLNTHTLSLSLCFLRIRATNKAENRRITSSWDLRRHAGGGLTGALLASARQHYGANPADDELKFRTGLFEGSRSEERVIFLEAIVLAKVIKIPHMNVVSIILIFLHMASKSSFRMHSSPRKRTSVTQCLGISGKHSSIRYYPTRKALAALFYSSGESTIRVAVHNQHVNVVRISVDVWYLELHVHTVSLPLRLIANQAISDSMLKSRRSLFPTRKEPRKAGSSRDHVMEFSYTLNPIRWASSREMLSPNASQETIACSAQTLRVYDKGQGNFVFKAVSEFAYSTYLCVPVPESDVVSAVRIANEVWKYTSKRRCILVPWRSRLVRHRFGVREALGSNLGKAWVARSGSSMPKEVPASDTERHSDLGSSILVGVTTQRDAACHTVMPDIRVACCNPPCLLVGSGGSRLPVSGEARPVYSNHLPVAHQSPPSVHERLKMLPSRIAEVTLLPAPSPCPSSVCAAPSWPRASNVFGKMESSDKLCAHLRNPA
ncbi:hypothetical protein PR048_030650 [Dryococelus australis]|uniref:Uncharacterized protein n=1 Tax=Dryococelus australis TaxID=614101 RepID=A0ABQ9G9Z8_9NEOP|nr:hypothetical protein PR048_030650 [Dryococelus australis]